MTGADAYLHAVQAAARERNPPRPFEVDQLTNQQRVDISTARLMSMSAEDCELLVCGELVPWREGGR